MQTKAEKVFVEAWAEHGYPESDITPEYKLGPYRFDFAWPEAKVLVEINGLGYGHQRIAAIERDATKTRYAILRGWIVLPFSTPCLNTKQKREDAIVAVMTMLENRMLGTALCDMIDEET